MIKYFKKHTFFIKTLSVIYILIAFFVNFQNQILHYCFPEKIWIHRVDSIEKLKEVIADFNSVELDVVYKDKEKVFDITHPPVKSINLSLAKYLSSIKLSNKNNFWLDFKNLNKNNAINSLNRLELVCEQFKLDRKQFIVESEKPIYLKYFIKKGYRTSYYLPSNLSKLTQEALNKELVSINQLNITDYISTDKQDYKLLKKYFSNEKIITWSFNFSENTTLNPYYFIGKLKSFYAKYNLLSDDTIKIVLFRYNAKINR